MDFSKQVFKFIGGSHVKGIVSTFPFLFSNSTDLVVSRYEYKCFQLFLIRCNDDNCMYQITYYTAIIPCAL